MPRYCRMNSGIWDTGCGSFRATHLRCFTCGKLFSWGPSNDEPKGRGGNDTNRGIGLATAVAIEIVAAEIVAGTHPMTQLHRYGWVDYYRIELGFHPSELAMTLTWQVGYLVAAMTDARDFPWKSLARYRMTSRSEVVTALTECGRCEAQPGCLCNTSNGTPHQVRITDASISAAQRLGWW